VGVHSDDPIALPQAPPPRPAARRAAIEAALRKFDGAEDAPQEPARKPALWAGWAGKDRRVAGALVTAALIAVVSIPLVLTTVRDNVPPSVAPPPTKAPVGESEMQAKAGAPAPRADMTGPSEAPDAPVATQPTEQPEADRPTPAEVVAPTASKSAQTGIMAAERDTSQAPAPPMAAAAPPPPPPPPPPPAPAPSAQMAEEAVTADNNVLTGSRVTRSNLESASPVAAIGSEDAFLAQLQAAIRANDRATIIGLVALPLRVNADGQRLTYRSARDVESDFDRIFTNRVKQSVLNQSPDTLRSRGKMRGTSRVWFGQTSPNGPVRIREVTP
jgi:hypothetical protein